MAPTKTRSGNGNVIDFPEDLTGPHPIFETGRETLPDDLQAKYDVVLASLQGDARNKLGFGFLEQMMCERLALLHCLGLERARQGIGEVNPAAAGAVEPGFVDLKEYSDFQKMWFDLAAKLQRAQAQTVAAAQSVQNERDRAQREYGTLITRIIESDEVEISLADRERMKDMAGEGFDIIFKGGHV